MSGSDDLYMLFCSGGVWFGIPILWVKRTAQAEEETKWPVWDFSGEKDGCGPKERRYLIFLERNECAFCLKADEIEGIWRRESAVGCFLPETLVGKKSRYLEEAVLLEAAGEETRVVFLLDLADLYRHMQEPAEREEDGQQQACETEEGALEEREEELPEETQLQDCLEAQVGEFLFYAAKENVQAVVGKPKIWEIPCKGTALLGISFYEGSPVIYDRYAKKQEAECGIIVRAEGAFYAGIAAQRAGTQGKVSGRFQPVMPGVWVKRE